MPNAADLYLEEYRSLRDEAKSFTDMNFRDVQFFATLIAAFMVVARFKEGASALAFFWSFAILQFVAFLFLVTQASRLVYVFALRERLRALEKYLNEPYQEKPFAWESTIVPSSLSNPSSLNYQSQMALGLSELLAFVVLAYFSIRAAAFVNPTAPYIALVLAEFLLLFYLAVRLALRKF